MKRRGVTLVELMAALSLILLTVSGAVGLTIGGLRSFQRTSSGIDMSESNARALRSVAQNLREAVSVAVSTDGTVIQYQMPQYSQTVDTITGERELLDPLQSDGVQREIRVTGGQLIDGVTGKTLVRDVTLIDPDPTSSQYNQTYKPFQVGAVANTRAVTITIMTRTTLTSGSPLFWRLKTTVLLRNAQ